MVAIEKAEFQARISRAQVEMERLKLDALMVYGDENRRENIRYFSNVWPIIERGAVLIPRKGEAILATAPEGEPYIREMSRLDNIHVVKEFECPAVLETLEYPFAKFTPLGQVVQDVLGGGKKLGLVGWNDLPIGIMEKIRAHCPEMEVVAADALAHELRLIKSPAEIACLKEAGRLACIGYKELMKKVVAGNTELEAAGAGEGAARAAGAEAITWTFVGSGDRSNGIFSRATSKVIEDGDMIMAGLAVQYEGYIATIAEPYVAGKASDEAKLLIDAIEESNVQAKKFIKAGEPMGNVPKAVRGVFLEKGLKKYDTYGSLHGAGLAEAESPCPEEKTTKPFEVNMCVNTDIGLWGHEAGGTRIEEGYVITEDGIELFTPLELLA